MSHSQKLWELFKLCGRLGFTAFGGPAAHIAMLHDEVVERRKWISEDDFLDLLGATNLIPGPNSTEMFIHIGYRQAGVAGLLVAGSSFIVPAVILVTILAWTYKEFGATPQAEWILYGIKPVIIAVILQALIKLGTKAVKGAATAAIGIGVLALYFLGVDELLLLLAGGLVILLLRLVFSEHAGSIKGFLPLPLTFLPVSSAVIARAFSYPLLFLSFLKIGSVLYGSGYVLLAFLRSDFVQRLGWLTDQQLIDAIAIGQLTPGPVFTTATFVGYLLGDLPGALLATLGIFLPAFVFVGISTLVIPKIRDSFWAASILDGVNVAALGLMAAVTWQLARSAIIDIPTILLAILSAVLLFRYKINSGWLVVGGGIFGYIIYQFT